MPQIRHMTINGVDVIVDEFGEVYKKAIKNSHSRGYYVVTIGAKPIFVHRLVAAAFHGPPQGDRILVNHLDGNKKNNNQSNLEWVSDRENKLHAKKTGLLKTGERHPSAILSEDDITRILQRMISGDSNTIIAKDYNISRSHISAIRHGKFRKNKTNEALFIEVSKIPKNTKIPICDLEKIKSRIDSGEKLSSIAITYNTSESNVCLFIKRHGLR